jgi:iron complex transport system permease protein
MTDSQLVLRSPGGGISLRFSRRVLVLIAALLAGLTAIGVWALTLGELGLAPMEVLSMLLGQGEGPAAFIVNGVRLPRLLTGAVAGFGLGIAGACFQRTVRNPLASPDILGISAGASLGAVVVIVLDLPMLLMGPVAALAALATAAFVLTVGHRGTDPAARTILVGIGAGAFITGIVSFAMIRADANLDAERIYRYTTGSLGLTNWLDWNTALIGVAVLVPIVLLLERRLLALELGDDLSGGLGFEAGRTSLLVLATASLLAGAMIAASGPIGFVALVAPHATRAVIGRLSGSGVIVAGLLGALMLTVSDMIGQHVFPVQLPAGAITAAIGAPYFVLLLVQGARRGRL